MSITEITIVILRALKSQVAEGKLTLGADPGKYASEAYNTLSASLYAITNALPESLKSTPAFEVLINDLRIIDKSINNMCKEIDENTWRREEKNQ